MTDPNTWTKSYVQQNKNACVAYLIETNKKTRALLEDENYTAAIAGIDRVLNGMVTMQNAGCGNFRPHIAVMSSVEGTVLAFADLEVNGKTATEENKRATAIKAFEDACDFASSSGSLKDISREMVRLLKTSKSLKAIAADQGVRLPENAIDGIDTVTKQLEKIPTDSTGTSGEASSGSGGGGGSGCGCAIVIAIAALLLLGVIAFFWFMNKGYIH